jgi:DNA mismatch repair ATPase MutS
VIERAKDILNALEEGCIREDRLPKPEEGRGGAQGPRQLSLFETRPDPVADELRQLRLEHVTPMEALNILKRLKEKSDGTD